MNAKMAAQMVTYVMVIFFLDKVFAGVLTPPWFWEAIVWTGVIFFFVMSFLSQRPKINIFLIENFKKRIAEKVPISATPISITVIYEVAILCLMLAYDRHLMFAIYAYHVVTYWSLYDKIDQLSKGELEA